MVASVYNEKYCNNADEGVCQDACPLNGMGDVRRIKPSGLNEAEGEYLYRT